MGKYSVVYNCQVRSSAYGLTQHFTDAEWQHLLSSTGNKCLCCNISFAETYATADHVVPLTLGGANTIDNIQPLCKRCNSRKHQKHIDYRQSADQHRGLVLSLRPPPKDKKPKAEESALMLRLPPELHVVVKEIAVKNRRSLNSQCIILLENAIAAELANPPTTQEPTHHA